MPEDDFDEFIETMEDAGLCRSYMQEAFLAYQMFRKPLKPGEVKENLNRDPYLRKRKGEEYNDAEVNNIIEAGERSGIIEEVDGRYRTTDRGKRLIEGIDRIDFVCEGQ